VAYYFVTQAAPGGPLATIVSAALLGGAFTGVVAVAVAAGVARFWPSRLPDATGPMDVRGGPEQGIAHQTPIDGEMAQAIIDWRVLDAFVQTDEHCVILGWSPHAEALMGWTRAEASAGAWKSWSFRKRNARCTGNGSTASCSEALGDAVGGRYETPLLHKDGCEFFAEVSLTALRRGDGYIINAFVRDITAKRAAEEQLFQAQKDGIGRAIDRRHRP
jgi:PAS domain S-box-containing protein